MPSGARACTLNSDLNCGVRRLELIQRNGLSVPILNAEVAENARRPLRGSVFIKRRCTPEARSKFVVSKLLLTRQTSQSSPRVLPLKIAGCPTCPGAGNPGDGSTGIRRSKSVPDHLADQSLEAQARQSAKSRPSVTPLSSLRFPYLRVGPSFSRPSLYNA